MRIGIELGLTIARVGGAAFIAGLSNANATGGIALSCAGSLLSYAANTLRWGCLDGKRAVLVEAAATNFVKRSSHTEDYPWATTVSGAGLTSTLVGAGTDGDVPYADFAITGTNTGGGATLFVSQSAYSVAPAAVGQNWSSSVYAKVVSGVWPDGVSFGVFVIEQSDGAYYGGSYPSTPPSAIAQRFETNRTLTNASSTQVRAALGVVNLGPAGATTFTGQVLRIYGWQLEENAHATSLIQTLAGSVATRAADLVTAPITADVSGGVRVRGQFRLDAVKGGYDRVFQLDDDTDGNSFRLMWLSGLPGALYCEVFRDGASIRGAAISGGALGKTFDFDATITGDGTSGTVNGVPFSLAFSTTPIPVTVARIGHSSGGSNTPARLLCSGFVVTGVPA